MVVRGGVAVKSMWRTLGLVGLLAVAAVAVMASSLARERPALPLRMPVVGFAPSQVRSSYGAPRGGGRRRHHGVDLFAPRGTPVCAATSGIVVYKGGSELGGHVVYLFGEGVLTYYAHLDSWAPGLHVGQRVRRGTRLGRVGDSGNARGTSCHLHFAVQPLRTGLKTVDPAPLLVAAGAGRGGAWPTVRELPAGRGRRETAARE